MKKVKLLLVAIVCLFIGVLASCAKNHYVFTDVSGIVYAKGTQTVTVRVSEESTTFNKELKLEYITLSEQLKGKTVDSFTYVSDYKAEITLSGTLDSINTEVSYNYYNLELSSDALKGNSTATVTFTVYSSAPKISPFSVFYISGSTASSTFSLPYGNFIEESCNAQNITLLDSNGEITEIKLEDNQLLITVRNFTPTDVTEYPIVKVSANCTSFNIELYLYIGTLLSSADLVK